MNWLNFFYNKTTQLRHSFGRGINATISPNEEELFNKSYEAFESQDILKAYQYFFESLQNYFGDDSNENIITKLTEDKLHFTLYQGSAKVTGIVTKENLYAEVIMIKTDSAGVALKRYMLERNYQLTYAYYFSDSEYIKLKLHHDNIVVSPQKIFFPLREIALNADFDKEYMKNEFSDIMLEDTKHIVKLSQEELEIKYDYLHKWIDTLEAKILTLPTNDNAGMQAFLYLNILFKIDYLLVPKCEIYQKISKKIQIYFSDDSTSTEFKNDELRVYIERLKKMKFEDFSKKFYSAKYTFNTMEKSSQEEISNFISESLLKIRWYKTNRYTQIIPTIYNYISFYMLYNYGLNPVVKSLIHILVEIQNPSFFKALDYVPLYDEQTKTFAKKTIVSKIDEAIIPNKNQYKSLESFSDELNFSSMNELSNSFLLQLKHLNFEEI
ncbi:MAG: hypothetical protein U9N33_04980 [Campylobacterota bacterium]|nr:hypothetical protein [Campylobacterota bacterium]